MDFTKLAGIMVPDPMLLVAFADNKRVLLANDLEFERAKE